MSDKQILNISNNNTKVFNGELFVAQNLNEVDSESNNNSLRKSTSNSIRGSLTLIRGSLKSNHSNNNERFITRSLMQDLRGSYKKNSDKRIEFDKIKLKDQQIQLNSELSNNSNNNSLNNINEEDVLANIKVPKNEINSKDKPPFDDLYEDVIEEDNQNEEKNYDNEDENDGIHEIDNEYSNDDQMNDIININQLSKVNQYFNQYRNKKNNIESNGENIKNEREEQPLSLRSSSNSACISSHSNNSNGNMSVNMNMRSSKIFNKVKKDSYDNIQPENNSNGNLIHIELNNNNNSNISSISNNSKNESDNFENNNSSNNINNDNNINLNNDNKENNINIKDKNNEKKFINNNILNKENKNIKNEDEEDKIKMEMQIMQFEKGEEIEKNLGKEMGKEEYVFEKFGKLGWECEKCNNFNFESRTICNRCEAPKQPKSLEQIKKENEEKSGERKKKPLVERKGDWQCPICHNLNFAFRHSCNRCKLPKEIYLKMIMTQQNFNDNNMKMRNSFTAPTQIINNTTPQLIQNQFNFYQWGLVPIYNPNFVQPPAFSPAIQTNNNNINSMDNMNMNKNINANNINNMNNMNNIGSMNSRNSMNNKQIRGKKFNNHQGNFVLKSQFMNNYKENHNNLDNDLRGSGLKNKNRLNNNENLINNNNQIKEQVMSMNIQPQLYYYQNKIIPNHNYNIMLNNLNNLNQFENDNVGINK
jgi:hypothetical protein